MKHSSKKISTMIKHRLNIGNICNKFANVAEILALLVMKWRNIYRQYSCNIGKTVNNPMLGMFLDNIGQNVANINNNNQKMICCWGYYKTNVVKEVESSYDLIS